MSTISLNTDNMSFTIFQAAASGKRLDNEALLLFSIEQALKRIANHILNDEFIAWLHYTKFLSMTGERSVSKIFTDIGANHFYADDTFFENFISRFAEYVISKINGREGVRTFYNNVLKKSGIKPKFPLVAPALFTERPLLELFGIHRITRISSSYDELKYRISDITNTLGCNPLEILPPREVSHNMAVITPVHGTPGNNYYIYPVVYGCVFMWKDPAKLLKYLKETLPKLFINGIATHLSVDNPVFRDTTGETPVTPLIHKLNRAFKSIRAYHRSTFLSKLTLTDEEWIDVMLRVFIYFHDRLTVATISDTKGAVEYANEYFTSYLDPRRAINDDEDDDDDDEVLPTLFDHFEASLGKIFAVNLETFASLSNYREFRDRCWIE